MTLASLFWESIFKMALVKARQAFRRFSSKACFAKATSSERPACMDSSIGTFGDVFSCETKPSQFWTLMIRGYSLYLLRSFSDKSADHSSVSFETSLFHFRTNGGERNTTVGAHRAPLQLRKPNL